MMNAIMLGVMAPWQYLPLGTISQYFWKASEAEKENRKKTSKFFFLKIAKIFPKLKVGCGKFFFWSLFQSFELICIFGWGKREGDIHWYITQTDWKTPTTAKKALHSVFCCHRLFFRIHVRITDQKSWLFCCMLGELTLVLHAHCQLPYHPMKSNDD